MCIVLGKILEGLLRLIGQLNLFTTRALFPCHGIVLEFVAVNMPSLHLWALDARIDFLGSYNFLSCFLLSLENNQSHAFRTKVVAS